MTGTLGEWAIVGNFLIAVQDFRIGLPGMALQIIGRYLFIKYLTHNNTKIFTVKMVSRPVISVSILSRTSPTFASR